MAMRTVQLRVDDDTLASTQALAEKDDRPLAPMIRVLLKEALAHRRAASHQTAGVAA